MGLFNTKDFISYKDKDGRILIEQAIVWHLNKLEDSGKNEEQSIDRKESSFKRLKLLCRINNLKYLDEINKDHVKKYADRRDDIMGHNDPGGSLLMDLTYFTRFYYDLSGKDKEGNPFYEFKKELKPGTKGPGPVRKNDEY